MKIRSNVSKAFRLIRHGVSWKCSNIARYFVMARTRCLVILGI
jgi:hypothetical protein